MVRCDAEVHLLIFAECFIYQFCAECSQKTQQPLLFPLVGLQGLPGALDLLAFELCCIRYLKHSFLWAATPNLKTFAHTVISTDILLPRCPIPMQPLFCLEEDVMLHAETCSFSTVTCVWKTSKGAVLPTVGSEIHAEFTFLIFSDAFSLKVYSGEKVWISLNI